MISLFSKKSFKISLAALSIVGYGVFVFAAGPFAPGTELDPACSPYINNDPLQGVDTDCTVSAGGGSGWGLAGNVGTDDTVNFIGTTDVEDFVIRTNNSSIARFGQSGISLGKSIVGVGAAPIATGTNSLAWGLSTTASGNASFAGGFNATASAMASFAYGFNATASGNSSVAFTRGAASNTYAFAYGGDTTATASGSNSLAWGPGVIASGDNSTARGAYVTSRSYAESVFGKWNSDYTPSGTDGFNRLFAIGNGTSGNEYNAYTLWKDGSFAYNDDNFQNDNLGTEQNMFYFNYGNHDGLGGVQTKRAIRLGSVINDEWDINSANVGNRSIAIGFDGSAIAAGYQSFAIGTKSSIASGDRSLALGGIASGDASVAMSSSVASGEGSFAAGYSEAVAKSSIALGIAVYANTFQETVMGMNSFNSSGFAPDSNVALYLTDKLFSIGNGDGDSSNGTSMGVWDDFSDAFTILKNGETGIAIDNFEANTNGNIFQVGDGGTNVIGYVDDITGNWMNVSDERKKTNIQDLGYGLDTINQLSPKSFDYIRNNESSIGFLAQEVLSIVPEAVSGNEDIGYGMSYATLTPVLVKAIQELDLKLESIETASSSVITTSGFSLDGLRSWLGDVGNGIENIFARVIQADILKAKEQFCVGETCISETEFIQLLESRSITPDVSHESNSSSDSDNSLESENTDEVTDEIILPEDQPVTSSESSETEEIIPESGESESLGEITQ